MTTTKLHDDTFATAIASLPVCAPTHIVDLRDGDTYELRIAPGANRIGDSHVRTRATQAGDTATPVAGRIQLRRQAQMGL